MRPYDTAGNRLYLHAEERAAFLAVVRPKPARDRTLCDADIANNHAAKRDKNRPKPQRFCQVVLSLSTGRFSVRVGKRTKTTVFDLIVVSLSAVQGRISSAPTCRTSERGVNDWDQASSALIDAHFA